MTLGCIGACGLDQRPSLEAICNFTRRDKLLICSSFLLRLKLWNGTICSRAISSSLRESVLAVPIRCSKLLPLGMDFGDLNHA